MVVKTITVELKRDGLGGKKDRVFYYCPFFFLACDRTAGGHGTSVHREGLCPAVHKARLHVRADGARPACPPGPPGFSPLRWASTATMLGSAVESPLRRRLGLSKGSWWRPVGRVGGPSGLFH